MILQKKQDGQDMDNNYGIWEEVIERVGLLCRENKKDILLIAIDGRSGSGKTTLAKLLKKTYGGNIFHMDDYFLRPEQKTQERLKEIGGNVDYERFSEVILGIRESKKILYQPYDCHRQQLSEAYPVEPERINVVEGVYSMHPYFGDVYDYRIALDIEESEQKRRILCRNGEAMWKRFEREWIPKENAYLKKYGIYERCHLKIQA